jgi:hypothetical protein
MTSAENNVNQSFALTRDADEPHRARGTPSSLVAPTEKSLGSGVPCPLRPGFMPGRKGTALRWQTLALGVFFTSP